METPDKGLKVVDVLSSFESRFGRLSARDQAILAPDKVIMFLRAVTTGTGKILECFWRTRPPRVASPIYGKMCGISSHDTQRGGNGLLTKKRGVRNPKPRSVLEDHPPWARETTTEKGIDATTVEQLLKEMENLKNAM